jgi:hypothetical protein
VINLQFGLRKGIFVVSENENPMMDGLVFRSCNPFENLDSVRDIWLSLLDSSPHSYFTSWGWISAWINSLPRDCGVEFITACIAERPVISFFVRPTTRKKYGFLRSRILSLNSTADPYYDALYIEYNSILYDPAIGPRLDLVVHYLDRQNWDEFHLPGIADEFASSLGILKPDATKNFHWMMDESMPSFFVDLQKIRDAGMDFLKLLSSNKRSQIRRSIKQYEMDGEIQLREAQSTEEALSMLDQLAVLHQAEWTSKGQAGAFSNQYLYQFHRDLIRTRFDEKEMQLLHVYNQKMTIGYLYSFVYEGRVLFYQCGFNYLADNNYRPGLVSHYFAILHNASTGRSVYDFLAGDSAYKSSLSTNSTSMYWVRLIRNKNRFAFEKRLIALKDRIKALITKVRTRFNNEKA